VSISQFEACSRSPVGRGAFFAAQATASPLNQENPPLHIHLIAGLALALLLAVAALAREVRLRRALQELLRRLLTRWRQHFGTPHPPEDPDPADDDDDDDRRL
jgi:hypothetical protein